LLWIVPLAGFIATYLLVAGASLSNVDIRPQAEVAGLRVGWHRRAKGGFRSGRES
jgi:hypothetical protein